MLRTVASPGTLGCMTAASFIHVLRLLIRSLTLPAACGSPSHPRTFHDFVHQRGESASPLCTGRESHARSGRFYGGKARGPNHVIDESPDNKAREKNFFSPFFGWSPWEAKTPNPAESPEYRTKKKVGGVMTPSHASSHASAKLRLGSKMNRVKKKKKEEIVTLIGKRKKGFFR